jgi:hypothetical protein
METKRLASAGTGLSSGMKALEASTLAGPLQGAYGAEWTSVWLHSQFLQTHCLLWLLLLTEGCLMLRWTETAERSSFHPPDTQSRETRLISANRLL